MCLHDIRDQLGIGREASVDWSSFCREVVFEEIVGKSVPIGGEGKIVEIDEAKFGKRKYHRGHRVEGAWVFGAIERESGKIIMEVVEKRDKKTLMALIKKWILPGSIVMSDCWKAYATIGQEGYTHLSVNHSLHFRDPDSGACTNTIESCWRHAKEVISSHGRKKIHIPGNLAKYSFLKACRSGCLDTTVEFFKSASHLYPGNPLISVPESGPISDSDSESSTD